MSYPFIKKELPAESTNIFDNDINISQSDKPNEPLISNGFNSETNSIKNKLDNKDYQQKLKNNQKWKYMNNPFEHNISVKYKDFTDITTAITKKYNIKNKIISRSFFKMWEILKQYDLIDISKIERLVNTNPAPNHYSKFLFNFINCKIFLEQQVK